MKKRMIQINLYISFCLFLFPLIGFSGTIFQENFDDANFASRGWYDGNTGTVDTNNHISGSTASLICHFLQGGTNCNPADGMYALRHKFTPTSSIYMSYWVKHSANWVGSGKSYHPHMFILLTNLNDDYAGPAYSHLGAYVEENQGYPQLVIQDGQNIDETKIGVDLTSISENRSIAGCNGNQSVGQNQNECYASGSVHWNGVTWKGASAVFFDPAQITNWHFVEAYFQLNTVSNGIGQQDGILRYWFDGKLVIDHSNVILRTGQNPTMQFNQVIFSPYIGDGSPADQTFWIDDLTLATTRQTGTTSRPSPPTNLKAQ